MIQSLTCLLLRAKPCRPYVSILRRNKDSSSNSDEKARLHCSRKKDEKTMCLQSEEQERKEADLNYGFDT